MYVAGLKLGLGTDELARMTYPTLANMLDAAYPRTPEQVDGGTEVREATQEDIDAL